MDNRVVSLNSFCPISLFFNADQEQALSSYSRYSLIQFRVTIVHLLQFHYSVVQYSSFLIRISFIGPYISNYTSNLDPAVSAFQARQDTGNLQTTHNINLCLK